MPVVRIPVQITVPGLPSPAINVWHARVIDAGALSGGVTFPFTGPLGTLRNFYNSLKDWYPTSTVIRIPNVVVDTVTDEEYSASSIADITSSGGGGKAPQGLAVTLGWKTSIRSRRGRGRTFLGPLSGATLQDDGTPATLPMTQIASAADALISASLADNGWAFGVWGQEAAGAPSPKVLRDFTAHSINDKWAHLRTRRD